MSGLMIVANRLNANAALKALVPVARQFMVVSTQGATMPYLVISQVGGTDDVLLGGQGDYPRELIQVDVLASSYTSARAVADLVRAALVNTIKASISALNVEDVDITATGREMSDYNDVPPMVVIAQDFRVRWRRA